jgi:hypothetical protein
VNTPENARTDRARQVSSYREIITRYAQAGNRGPEVHLYKAGVAMKAPRQRYAAGPGGKRGKVVGWSSASRRRMRQFMLTMRPAPGLQDFGLTCTIPGPPMEPEASKRAWLWFCREVDRAGAGMVWRLEVQQRGALHWHAIVSAPSAVTRNGVKMPPAAWLRFLWWAAVETLGEFVCPEGYSGKDGTWKGSLTWSSSRMGLPGAVSHAVDVQEDSGGGAWRRYLQDHATKAKQEQIAQGCGRHWGVVGRKLYTRAAPDEIVELTEPQYWAFLRAWRRLCTPRVPDARCPFGRRLGWAPRRGKRGTAVAFSRPETVKRLTTWAKLARPERPKEKVSASSGAATRAPSEMSCPEP